MGNEEFQSFNTDLVKENGEIENVSADRIANPENIENPEIDRVGENIEHANGKDKSGETVNSIVNEDLNHVTKPNGLVKIISYIWFTVTTLLILLFVILYIKIKMSLRDKVLYKTLDSGRKVYQSYKINSPILLGLLKPVIVMPKCLDLSEQQFKHIVDHELMHMKRFDNYMKTFALLVVCIHWFNPLVWMSYFIAMKDMELSCDEQVLQSLNKAEQGYYADTLLQISMQHNNILATGLLAFGEQNVKARIKAVLGFKKVSKKVKIVSGVVIAVLFVVLISQANNNRNMDGQEIDAINEQDHHEKTGENNLNTENGENNGDKNNGQENNTQPESGYESVRDKVIGKGKVSLPGVGNVTVTLQMYSGKYYYDESPGAYQGDNWVGKCKLILSKNDEIVSEYILDDWDDENMTFQKEFEILFADYNEDGVVEFLIGQYLSSNLNEYRLYQITKWNKIVNRSEVNYLYITGAERYSCVIPTDQVRVRIPIWMDNRSGMQKAYYRFY